jgi:hypothetical protein
MDKIAIVFRTKELPLGQSQIVFAHTAEVRSPTYAEDNSQPHENNDALRDVQWQFRPYPLSI